MSLTNMKKHKSSQFSFGSWQVSYCGRLVEGVKKGGRVHNIGPKLRDVKKRRNQFVCFGCVLQHWLGGIITLVKVAAEAVETTKGVSASSGPALDVYTDA